MFTKKKKQKLDSRVRFQHATFTKKLGEARNFKRQPKSVTEPNKRASILSKIGLRSWWSQIIVSLVVLGIGYLIFIPNFLFINTIAVSGAESDVQTHTEQLAHDYFTQSRIYELQRNLLLLRTSKISSYITQRDTRILKITQIKRNVLKRTLDIIIEPKYIDYVINRPSGIYSV